jgi:DNA-binding Lrp family transcriptional regulator
MDSTDRRIINSLQGDFPVSERPYREAAKWLGLNEEELLFRIERLLNSGVLSRFGPMYNADRMGGGLTLAAMSIPDEEFDMVADTVNGFIEVAHNYRREHHFNMWFVIATETPAGIQQTIDRIESASGYPVYSFPKIEEFFVGARFEA